MTRLANPPHQARMTMTSHRLAIAALALSILTTPPAQGAEIKAMISGAARSAFDELIPRFQRATGHTVSARYEIQQALLHGIDAGEPFDVVVLSIDVAGLIKQGKVVVDSRTVLGRTGVGVAVR